jgi:hypothetical protein
MASEQTGWIIGPPAPGEVTIHIAVDESAELTPELRRAIDGLMQALHQDEVSGYAMTDSPIRRIRVCDVDGKCQPKSTQPCLKFTTCRIQDD